MKTPFILQASNQRFDSGCQLNKPDNIKIQMFSTMKESILFILFIFTLLTIGCVPLEKIYRHDFDSGYFKLKTPENKVSEVYMDLKDDTVTVFNISGAGKSKAPDLSTAQGIKISEIKPGSLLYKNTLVRRSLDFDLSTVALRYRPESSGVPNQLSYNINTVLYLGIRRDFFIVKSHHSPLRKENPFIRQIGFDAGILAGIGITPINPSVTNSNTPLEYDGWFFQKGVAAFITIERMSVGISLGFDNLLDKNSSSWIYNQKPWIGIVLGISNF